MKRTVSNANMILAALIVIITGLAQSAKCEVKKLTLNSKSDNLPISVMISIPDKGVEIKGVVQIVHGMCEYKERYIPFMRFLNDNGYVTIIHDHRGHGASVLSSEDLGYFYDGGYEGMIDDVKMVGDYIRKEYDGKPFFLFGHSMGSMVVRSYTKRYDKDLKGLIVCGSPSYNSSSKLGVKMAKREMRKNGEKSRPEWIQRMSFSSFNKRFKDEGSPNAWVCSDKEVVKAYDNDSLCNYQFTANGFYNLFSLMQDAYSDSEWIMENAELPIMFISGEDDPCMTNRRGFEKAYKHMGKVGYTNVQSKLYPGMRHEILNETDKAIVWNDVLKFLNGLIKVGYIN